MTRRIAAARIKTVDVVDAPKGEYGDLMEKTP